MTQDANEILEGMDVLWRNFVNCRAHFPYVPNDMIGQTAAQTSPFYVL